MSVLTPEAGKVQQQLQSAWQLLGKLNTGSEPGFVHRLQQIEQGLQDLTNELDAEFSAIPSALAANAQQTAGFRQRLTDIRTKIHRLHEAIEKLKELVVQEYRTVLGAEKEEFEKLSPAMKQQTNPQAYECLKNYHSLNELERVMMDVNGTLMDLSANLERKALAAMADKGGREIGKPADPHVLDEHDPAPHHLSP
ncbi:hypothetical protein BSNK01_06380 [Bacillaceae bacterium]